MRSSIVRRLSVMAALVLVPVCSVGRAAGAADPIGKAESLAAERKFAEALPLLETALDAATTDADRTRCLVGLGSCSYNLDRRAEARKYYIRALEICPESTAGLTGNAIGFVVSLATSDDEVREALVVLEKVSVKGILRTPSSKQYVPELALRVGTCRFLLGDTVKARETLQAAMADPVAEASMKGRASLVVAQCYLKEGKAEEALKAVLAVRAQSGKGVASTELQQVEAEAMKEVVQRMEPDRACTLLRDIRLREIDSRETTDAAQLGLIDVLAAAGDFPQACREAGILMETCTSKNMAAAVAKTAMVLKAADGNLLRANAFLEYQKYLRCGPDGKLGTADDLENPLARTEQAPDTARDQLFQKALDERPKTWNGALARARICRYWGKPAEALREFKRAFALAPMEADPLKQITDETVEVLLQVTGDFDVGKRFVEFQKYGPGGPDGKVGTQDDLKNPVDACLATLQPAKPPPPKP